MMLSSPTFHTKQIGDKGSIIILIIGTTFWKVVQKKSFSEEVQRHEEAFLHCKFNASKVLENNFHFMNSFYVITKKENVFPPLGYSFQEV